MRSTVLVGAGGGPPPHRHLAENELFMITEGSISFTAGDETRSVSAGQSVFVPRGARHLYRNEGTTPARMIAVYTPAGMEGWFREVLHAGGRSVSPATAGDR